MAKNFFKRQWLGFRRSVNDNTAEINDDIESGGWLAKLIIYFLLFCFLFVVGVGMYWSSEPDPFDVRVVAEEYATENGHQVVIGTTTTATMIVTTRYLLDKPGGFLSNDVMPPGLWLDNMPSWEYGALIQIRDLSKAMRERFSRSQSQSIEDEDLALAENRFNVDNSAWLFPRPEAEYAEAAEYLENYLRRLGDADQTNAQFFSRADNLRYWLSNVETRLGSLSQRLSASVGQRRLNLDISSGSSGEISSISAPRDELVQTPWMDIDNVFYEARGSAWALAQFLRAVEVDFADVLEDKNALVSLQQIIRELEATQVTIWSPMILNGDGFGFLANHSLVLASYISRANAGIIDLRELLSQG
ncbi:DUF2333 family protein [Aurantivibrio infirmus]